MVGAKYRIVFIICLSISFGIGAILGSRQSIKFRDLKMLAQYTVRQQKEYRFINPLLECEASEYTIQSMLRPFRDQLDQVIEESKDDGRAQHISLYFRDLNNGLWTDLESNVDYSPTALLKVPLMIAYFKKEEQNPGFLQTTIVHRTPPDTIFVTSSTPKEELVIGGEYTYEQLIVYAITKSSDSAAWELTEHMNATELEKVYTEMGIDFREDENNVRVLSTRTYASFFRILFNASYLSRELSEKVLYILAQSSFSGGIVAGVPTEVPVAHKYGERVDTTSGIFQVHDCGIVYFPNHPYLLCIMTKGGDYVQLQQVIAEISRIVYAEVHQQAQAFPISIPTSKFVQKQGVTAMYSNEP